MHVVVGGARLREHMMPTARSSAQSAAFVETDFFSPASYRMTTMETDPYGEAFEQRWPVTPFQLELTNNTDQLVRAYVHIDGTKTYARTIDPRSLHTVEGIQAKPGSSRSEERAMVFSRPRQLQRGESCGATADDAELESIRVDYYRCARGKKSRKKKRGATGAGFAGANGGAAKSKSNGMARSGGITKRAKGNHYYSRKNTTYELMGSIRIRYGDKHRLQSLGVWTASKNPPPGGAIQPQSDSRRTAAAVAAAATPAAVELRDDDSNPECKEITAEQAGVVPETGAVAFAAARPTRGSYIAVTVRDQDDDRHHLRMRAYIQQPLVAALPRSTPALVGAVCVADSSV